MPTAVPVPNPAMKRINVNLPEQSYQDLQKIAWKLGGNMTEVIRIALALVKLAFEAGEKKEKLVIMSDDGKSTREILIPGL